MARRPYKALAVLPTTAGEVLIRKKFDKRQGWILIFESHSHPALRLVLPDWKPRAPSTRTQLSPPHPIRKVSDVLAWFQSLLPTLYRRAAGTSPAIPTTSPPSPVYRTLGELGRLIDAEAFTALRSGSIATYRRQWAAILRHLPPDTALVDITRERLQALIGELGQTYSSSTVVCLRNLLRKALRRAVEDHVLVSSPLAKVKVPRPVTKMQVPLSAAQREAVLKAAEQRGTDVALLFHLLLGTGVRRSEALALRWEDVDLERRQLLIRSSEHFLTKTGSARSLPIPAELHALLCRAWKSSGFVLKPEQEYGGRYRWDFSRIFLSVMRAAGVPNMTPHSCRHSYASWALEQGTSLFRLASYLGHSMVETTQRYAHLVPGYGVAAVGGTGGEQRRSVPA